MTAHTHHRVRLVNVQLKPHMLPRVTHHALLRYAERSCGFDADAARSLMSGPEVQKAILHGAGAVVMGDLKFILEKNAVVTVLGKGQRPNKTKRIFRAFEDLKDLGARSAGEAASADPVIS